MDEFISMIQKVSGIKKKKQPRTKMVYLGKEDATTGKIIPPAKDRPVKIMEYFTFLTKYQKR